MLVDKNFLEFAIPNGFCLDRHHPGLNVKEDFLGFEDHPLCIERTLYRLAQGERFFFCPEQINHYMYPQIICL